MAGSVSDVLKRAQKRHGAGIGGMGAAFPEAPRLATGILAFDIASGGGIPLNRMTIAYGTESAGKTNFALKCVAAHQRAFPDKTCAYVDIENVLCTDWAEKMGVDPARLGMLRPMYAEQVVDIVDDLLSASDCGLVVLDSIAAMCTMQEQANSAEKEAPGTQARAVSKLVRKCTSALGVAEADGRCPTLLWVNQISYKIGVVFGNPENMPGGTKQKFMASMQVRLAGKNVLDSRVSKTMPVVKQTSGVIQKWKCPIVGRQFRYDMVMVPHDGRGYGECREDDIFKQYGLALGIVEKVKGGYSYRPTGDGPFGTYGALFEWLREPERRDAFRDEVIARLRADPSAGQEAEA